VVNGTGIAGDIGSASVLINNSGTINANGFIIGGGLDGHLGGGAVTVDGAQSTFQVNTTLSVGNFGAES